MEGFVFRDQQVFIYRTMLFSASPLLQEIYVDSHRFEPWSVLGIPERTGRIPFSRTLYVDDAERRRLLERIPAMLLEDPTVADALLKRVRSDVVKLVSARRAIRTALRTSSFPSNLSDITDTVIDGAARILSSGIWKEALAPDAVEALIGMFTPLAPLRPHLLSLYQPLCMPHFLLFESRLLQGAKAYGDSSTQAARNLVIAATSDRAAHLARFQLERHALHAPEAMRARLLALLEHHGGTDGVTLAAGEVLSRHKRAVDDARASGDAVCRVARRYGPSTLRSRRLLAGIVRLVQVVASLEEFKHVLALEAVSTLRTLIERLNLDAETTDRETLLAATHSLTTHALTHSTPSEIP